MVALPNKPSPTIDAICEAREASADRGFRNHLGASLVGNECNRALWYSFRWATRPAFKGRILRLFETGNLAEARFVADLRSVGVTVMELDPDTGRQWSVRDDGGHFGGSADGIGLGLLEAPKTSHLLEFKTHSEKSFNDVSRKGVQVSKPTHYAQMQVYMHFLGLTRAYYMAVNKNTDELYGERVEYDMTEAVKLVAKAQSVINAPRPPERISIDRDGFACRFCDHKPVCFDGARPEVHCRSCLHSTPAEGGAWTCARWGCELDPVQQREGCATHLYLPQLVDGEQIDADLKHDWVEYKMRDGSIWRDGDTT